MTAEYAFESLQSYPIYLWGGVTDCVAGCVNEKGQWGLHWDESDLLTKVVAAAVDVAAVGGSDDDDDVDDLGCLKGRKEIFFFCLLETGLVWLHILQQHHQKATAFDLLLVLE